MRTRAGGGLDSKDDSGRRARADLPECALPLMSADITVPRSALARQSRLLGRTELFHAQGASRGQAIAKGRRMEEYFASCRRLKWGRAMSSGKHEEIWIEQCEAAQTIKLRYGVKAAFDYAVGEKLMNFAEAACDRPAFARELPRFVSEVRRMFSADELRLHLARLEREQSEQAADLAELGEEEILPESPDRAATRDRQFAMLKELLTATTLGTS